jgi:hypothetical protein
MDECKNRAPGSLEWEETDSHSVDDNEGCKTAWFILKPELAPTNWTVGESATYYGFFSWGYQSRQPEIDALKEGVRLACAAQANVSVIAEIDALKAENEKLLQAAEEAILFLSSPEKINNLGQYLAEMITVRDNLRAAMTAHNTKGE